MFSIGDRVIQTTMNNRKGTIADGPILPGAENLNTGKHSDYSYVVKFDDGECALIGERVLERSEGKTWKWIYKSEGVYYLTDRHYTDKDHFQRYMRSDLEIIEPYLPSEKRNPK